MNKTRLHRAVQQYSGTVFKIAMVILRNPHDADDAYQETFLRYFKHAPEFESAEHEKAWIIRCAINVSKSLRHSIFRHSHEPLTENVAAPASGSLPAFMLGLPLKERMILQLRFVEGYRSDEIAKMLNISAAAVRKRLERARKRAKEIYERKE